MSQPREPRPLVKGAVVASTSEAEPPEAASVSRFERAPAAAVGARLGAAKAPYSPTLEQVMRPTDAASVNIRTGERVTLNPAQMSDAQGVAFVQERLAALGFAGSLTATNATAPSAGPFGIDYGSDSRRHWDIAGLNVGLVLNLYAMNPPHVADQMLAADMQRARSEPLAEGFAGPRIDYTPAASPAASAPFAAVRVQPGVNVAAALAAAQRAPAATSSPTLADVSRPTTAASVSLATGVRTALNPAQLSTDQGVNFVRERLAALGYRGPGVVSNQTAPSVGPFRIDSGDDERRHWDIDGMNVGLLLQLYANNPREVADRMVADLIKTQRDR